MVEQGHDWAQHSLVVTQMPSYVLTCITGSQPQTLQFCVMPTMVPVLHEHGVVPHEPPPPPQSGFSGRQVCMGLASRLEPPDFGPGPAPPRSMIAAAAAIVPVIPTSVRILILLGRCLSQLASARADRPRFGSARTFAALPHLDPRRIVASQVRSGHLPQLTPPKLGVREAEVHDRDARERRVFCVLRPSAACRWSTRSLSRRGSLSLR